MTREAAAPLLGRGGFSCRVGTYPPAMGRTQMISSASGVEGVDPGGLFSGCTIGSSEREMTVVPFLIEAVLSNRQRRGIIGRPIHRAVTERVQHSHSPHLFSSHHGPGQSAAWGPATPGVLDQTAVLGTGQGANAIRTICAPPDTGTKSVAFGSFPSGG